MYAINTPTLLVVLTSPKNWSISKNVKIWALPQSINLKQVHASSLFLLHIHLLHKTSLLQQPRRRDHEPTTGSSKRASLPLM
mmetsp:Transcript_42571/g.69908  ORF Transcript_42571/g.69908 Transcript_42571/m.69908 type:complete len:82 (-) Transcript_42571:211-456(-)